MQLHSHAIARRCRFSTTRSPEPMECPMRRQTLSLALVVLFTSIFCLAAQKESSIRTTTLVTPCNQWITTDGAGAITDWGCPQGQAASCTNGRRCYKEWWGSLDPDG